MPDGKEKFIAKVVKNLGTFRLQVETYPTNELHNALIPGSFRNRIWIKTDDYVLIEISTEIGGSNCYIIHKYDPNEIDELVALNVLVEKKTEESNIIFGEVTDDVDGLVFEDI